MQCLSVLAHGFVVHFSNSTQTLNDFLACQVVTVSNSEHICSAIYFKAQNSKKQPLKADIKICLEK